MRHLLLMLTLSFATTAFAMTASAQDIDLNSASTTELEELPGVGPKLAKKIVRDRRENGPYSSVEDLARVPGLSSRVVQKIADSNLARVEVRRARTSSKRMARRGSPDVGEVLKTFKREPSVRAVQEAALNYVRVNPDIVDSWRVRARTNAIMPEFRARFDYDLDDDLSVRQDADTGSVQTKDDDRAYQLEFRATWDLNRLIFEPLELASNREAIRLANLRDRVLDEVTRRYFERRRVQVDMQMNPPNDVGDAVRKELRIQELTADIDSLTGGWFGRELKKIGKNPY